MPFISLNYSVSEDREGHAIAGLSMGAMESLHIGVRMPDVFAFIGSFSAAPTLPLTADQMTLPAQFMNNTFIMLCSGTEDGLITNSNTYNQWLTDNGVRTFYYKIPGVHDFNVWKNGLYWFAKCIF